MATLKALKIRIGSVSSSEKITGAMKMISSAKVHKSELALRRLTPYQKQIKSIMGHILATDTEFDSPLIQNREVKKIGIVVYGTDDGLCGAYNINVFKHLLVEINSLRERYGVGVDIELIPVGRKLHKPCQHLEGPHLAVRIPRGVDSKMEGPAVDAFTQTLKQDFLVGNYDMVEVVHMRFFSMSKQRPRVEQLFPVTEEAIQQGPMTQKKEEADNKLYIFEPDANTIFNEVLPMFVLSTMQDVTIQNQASEQAARVMAMQSANDNAKNLLDELQLEYNKLRQQSITTELLDIIGGQVKR